jgi:hypothetical protein
MAKYDGLIIPRSYNDYINKSDPAGVAQALQLTGVMDNAPTAQSTKPAKSGGIFALNAVIMASNKTLSGVAISAGSVVRVLFTAALTGSDATTGLTLTYNGSAYAVKVGKNGVLADVLAHLVDENYVYVQAYTTLELMFNGSQFVVMGNPVVISNADFSVMADGSKTYTANVTPLKQNTAQSIRVNLTAGASTQPINTPSTAPFLIIVQTWATRCVYVGSEWGNEWRFSRIFGEIDLVSFTYSQYALVINNVYSDLISLEIILQYPLS